MTRARGAWLFVVLAAACVSQDRVPPTGPVATPGPQVPVIQRAPGDVQGPFPVPVPGSNMQVVPSTWVSTPIVMVPGVAYSIGVSGQLTFSVNAGYASCPNTPPPPVLPGGNVVGPQGMAQSNHPYGVIIGIGTATQPPSSAQNIHEDGAASIHAFAGGPGVIWIERPVIIPGAVEGPNCPFSPAYDVTGQQSISATELPPAVIDVDKTHVSVGEIVQAQLNVPWTTNFFLLQGWTWVTEDGGPSSTRFLSACSRFTTTCVVEVHERGHLRIVDIVAEGQVFLTAVSPTIETSAPTVSVTARLETTNPNSSFTAANAEHTIRLFADVTPAQFASRTQWRVEANPGYFPTPPLPSPAPVGPETSFIVTPLDEGRWPHAHADALALAPKQLSYRAVATVADDQGVTHESGPAVATQDETDTMREEYVELRPGRIPLRGEFEERTRGDLGKNTGDYTLAIINPTFEADLLTLQLRWSEQWQLNALYRNPVHNRFHAGGAANSWHQYGCAADIQTFPFPRNTPQDLARARAFWNRLSSLARRMNFDTEPIGDSGVGHVHVEENC